MRGKFRDPVNGLTHLAAALLAAAGLGLLLYLAREDGSRQVSLAVYGSSLVLMFLASASYHLIQAQPNVVQRLRKLDHSAIYLLIAGTYTPICLHFFEGFWRLGLAAIVWTLALIGIGVKVFVIRAPRWVTAGVYLLMGWMSIFAIRQILATMPVGAMVWLLLGGIFFTLGAGIYVLKRPNIVPGVFGFHELWHIFVILGAFSHFVLIAAYVAPGPPL